MYLTAKPAEPIRGGITVGFEYEDPHGQSNGFNSCYGFGFADFMALFALSQLTALELVDQLQPGDWDRLFAQYPNLESLTVECCRSIAFYDVLDTLIKPPSTDLVPVVCPRLQQLSILGAWCTAGFAWEVDRTVRQRASRGAAMLDIRHHLSSSFVVLAFIAFCRPAPETSSQMCASLRMSPT